MEEKLSETDSDSLTLEAAGANFDFSYYFLCPDGSFSDFLL